MSVPVSIDPLEELGPVVKVRVVGEIDMDNSDEVGSSLLELVPDEAAGLAIDLGGLTYVDSAGIRVFVELSDRLRRNGQQLALAVSPGAPIHRVVSLVKLDLVVPLREDIEAASSEIVGGTS
jgi:anti-anti-sigma factor